MNNRKHTKTYFGHMYSKYEPYFDWYEKIPLILAIIVACGSIIGTIISFVYLGWYGFWVLASGVYMTVVTYFITMIIVSYKILHLNYLKELIEQTKDVHETVHTYGSSLKNSNNGDDSLPEI